MTEFLYKRSMPCFVVLDAAYRIVSSEPRLEEFLNNAGLKAEEPLRLPQVLEHAVASGADCIVGGLIVRAVRLSGPHGECAAVTLERVRTRDPLRAAADRYKLTKREREVLACILVGLEAREIAARLEIAESTVAEYFKRLYMKTGANNRAAMLARVFQWESSV